MAEGNGTQRELGEIQATLRAIQTDQAEARQTRRDMYKAIGTVRDEVRQVSADVASLKATVEEMKPLVDDYRSTKAKGIGILIGVAAAGGTVGAGVRSLLAKVGIGS